MVVYVMYRIRLRANRPTIKSRIRFSHGKSSSTTSKPLNFDELFGDDGYTQKWAEYNNIPNRGLIYPNQIIKRL